MKRSSLPLLFVIFAFTSAFTSMYAQSNTQPKTAAEIIEKRTAERQEEIAPCNSSKPFRVKDDLLEKNGFGTAVVENNPTFKGGIAALQKYFDDNLIKSDIPDNGFARIPIVLRVNCKGKVGDVSYPGKTSINDDFNAVVTMLSRKVRRMPDWEAGKVAGKEVDTYVRLNFMIARGVVTVSLP